MAQPTHTTTGHTPVSGHGNTFPPFKAETYVSQVFWLGLCFAILYVMVAKVALPRMTGILAARRAKIDADLAEAARLKDDADTASAAYDAALAEARSRAQAIAAETRERLRAETEAHREAVEAGLSERLAAAEHSITASKVAAMSNVRSIAVDTAGEIVNRLVGAVPTSSTVSAAVDQVLKR